LNAPSFGHSVARAKAGEQLAYAELYRRCLPAVHAIMLSRHPPAVADELTQECFARAFRLLHQLRNVESFGGWVCAMARHMRGTREASYVQLEAKHSQSSAVDPSLSVEASEILKHILALSENYRETLLMHLVEGMSGPEIALATGLTTGSVRVNLHRGLQKLRASLGLRRDP
jgi:RNA polymerase sigma-70 factor (ECF subfamily)